MPIAAAGSDPQAVIRAIVTGSLISGDGSTNYLVPVLHLLLVDLRFSPHNLSMKINGYQKRKAKAIAGVLALNAAISDTPMAQLAQLASRMTSDQWRTVAFSANQPVPDEPCKIMTVALLLEMA